MLSIIIPTLNTAQEIGATIAALDLGQDKSLVSQIIIADGGSSDGTCENAEQLGAHVVNCQAGRGGQLAAGAMASNGDWLLFVHADTELQVGWQEEARSFIEKATEGDGDEIAGVFRFRLDDTAPMARVLEGIVAARCSILGLPYGDQGLLMSRRFYDQLGGFRDVPLMEDVDFIRRIGRWRLHYFSHCAVTSARRYKRDGYFNRMVRNAACLAMWFAGVNPDRILRFYK